MIDRRAIIHLVPDPPPLAESARLRDELRTVRRIRTALVVAAALIGALCLGGCHRAEAEALPDPDFASVVASECLRVCGVAGVAVLDLSPTSARCSCAGPPSLGVAPRVGRRP